MPRLAHGTACACLKGDDGRDGHDRHRALTCWEARGRLLFSWIYPKFGELIDSCTLEYDERTFVGAWRMVKSPPVQTRESRESLKVTGGGSGETVAMAGRQA